MNVLEFGLIRDCAAVLPVLSGARYGEVPSKGWGYCCSVSAILSQTGRRWRINRPKAPAANKAADAGSGTGLALAVSVSGAML